MNSERYRYLKFIEQIFPPVEMRIKVKVWDKRFKKGYFIGTVESKYQCDPWNIPSYRIHLEGKPEWHVLYVHRDKIEVLKND